jgi:hypothetical protein
MNKNFITFPNGGFTIFSLQESHFNFFKILLYTPFIKRDLYNDMGEKCCLLSLNADSKIELYKDDCCVYFIIRFLGFGISFTRQWSY